MTRSSLSRSRPRLWGGFEGDSFVVLKASCLISVRASFFFGFSVSHLSGVDSVCAQPMY